MELSAAIGGVMIVLTLAGILARYLSGKLDLFSFQTFFLFGMVAFFFAPMLAYKFFEYDTVYRPDGSGWMILSGGVVMFMLVYIAFSRIGRRSFLMDKVLPRFTMPCTVSGLVITGVVGVISAVVIYRLFYVPGELTVLSIFVLGFIPSIMAFSVQLFVVLIIKKPGNLLFWVLGVATFGGGVLLAVSLSSDRRFVLGVLLAVPWMVYYAWLRYKPAGVSLMVSAIGIGVATTFTVAYTNLRHTMTFDDQAVSQRVSQLQGAAASAIYTERNIKAVAAQDAAIMSMYYIENYPNNFKFMPFQGLLFAVVNPVPRALWPDNPFLPEKPIALGMQMQAALKTGGNLGTGIIGHGWAELGWVGIAYYAVFFGFLMSAIDRSIRLRISNPYFIAAIGASMGNVLALARGETSLFLVLIIYGMLGIWLVVFALQRTLRPLMLAGTPVEFGPPEGYIDRIDSQRVDADEMIESGSYADYNDPAFASDGYSEHGDPVEGGEPAGGGVPGAMRASPAGLDSDRGG